MKYSELIKMNGARSKGKYGLMRSLTLAGMLLLAFFAVAKFPLLYENGLSATEWGVIISAMLSFWVLLYLERASSSMQGHRPHDLNTRGGSLHDFSFGNLYCKECGKRLILAFEGEKEELVFPVPGEAAENGQRVRLYCPACSLAVDEADCERRDFARARISAAKFSRLGLNLKELEAYVYSRAYTGRCIFISVLMLMATASSFYFARREAVYLLLPLVVGYFMFTSVYSMLSAVSARFYLCEKGVICRSLWSITMYPFEAASALVKYENSSNSWGFITAKENIMISPIISNHEDMASGLQAMCLEREITVIHN